MAVDLQEFGTALAELSRLRFGEMRVEDAMRDIVQTTHTIFGVSGAGLMLADGEHHLRNAAVSDERLRHLEDLQIYHQEGPCITAFEEQELVGVEDLTQDQRWPRFTAAAVDRGVRAVLASPLPYNQNAVGVVAVLSDQRHPWTPEGELALLALTDLAALLIATVMQGEQQSQLAGQLQLALNTRTVIEQAKGVLVGQQGLTPAPGLSAAARPGPHGAPQAGRGAQPTWCGKLRANENVCPAPLWAVRNGHRDAAETPRPTQRSVLAIGRLRHCVGVAPPGSTPTDPQTLNPFG